MVKEKVNEWDKVDEISVEKIYTESKIKSDLKTPKQYQVWLAPKPNYFLITIIK